MSLSTLLVLAALTAPVADATRGACDACALSFEVPAIPFDEQSLPLLYADEEESETDDDLVIGQAVFLDASSLADMVVVLHEALPSPCPVLSSRAARSPPGLDRAVFGRI